MYEESRQDLSLLPKNVQTMAWAYHEISTGEDPWTALGNFTNAWYGYAKHIRSDLVREALAKPEQETEHLHHWGAFCAASVEFLCNLSGVPCPEWPHDLHYILPLPWYGDIRLADTAVLQHRIQTSPVPFAKRNVFCGNRLYQNKYEKFEWIQEAHSKGITNPGEIRRYAHQREIAIYGAP
ncbi:MAG: hypothetical protein H0W02_03005 [Ktedonobacteraceae bacterium]|nr:hypothetical protein [Ktedonobacteraceae bacterium]